MKKNYNKNFNFSKIFHFTIIIKKELIPISPNNHDMIIKTQNNKQKSQQEIMTITRVQSSPGVNDLIVIAPCLWLRIYN